MSDIHLGVIWLIWAFIIFRSLWNDEDAPTDFAGRLLMSIFFGFLIGSVPTLITSLVIIIISQAIANMA